MYTIGRAAGGNFFDHAGGDGPHSGGDEQEIAVFKSKRQPSDMSPPQKRASGRSALVEMRGIRKNFGTTHALRGVDVTLKRGEIHALLGENGAGKSTLVKLLAGIHAPDGGQISIDGQPVEIVSPSQSRQLGMSFVFQELSPFPTFTVAEYLAVGRRYPRRVGGRLVDWSAIRRAAVDPLLTVGAEFPPTAVCSELTTVQERQLEIAKGLAHDARLIVLDEPTASLSQRETALLMQVLRELREAGIAILYVSHRLEEVFALADQVSIFRDGQMVDTAPIGDCTMQRLVDGITGGVELVARRARTVTSDETALSVDAIETDSLRDFSIAAKIGEIVGLAGLVGSGRTEAFRAITGIDSLKKGEIRRGGSPIEVGSPRDALSHGIAYLPEERKTEAVLGGMSIRENVTLSTVRDYAWPRRFPLIVSKARERRAVERWQKRLQVKMRSPDDGIATLSGGNQQKIMLGRLLDTGARVLLLDEPTKGVDVGARSEIFDAIRALAEEGVTVLFISSDLDEVCDLCDRAVVMREGEAISELEGDSLRKDAILDLVFTSQRNGARHE